MTMARLLKEEKGFVTNPIDGVIVAREGQYNFHFLLYNLDEEYKGGYYHGVFILPSDYPFKPPKLKFFTPSGRFEIRT